jgi:hypothetical protein
VVRVTNHKSPHYGDFFQLPVTSFFSRLNMYFRQEIYHPVKSKSPLTLTSACLALTIHKSTTKRGLNTEVVVFDCWFSSKKSQIAFLTSSPASLSRIFARQTWGAPWNYPQTLPYTTPTNDHNHPSTRRYITYTAGQAFLK